MLQYPKLQCTSLRPASAGNAQRNAGLTPPRRMLGLGIRMPGSGQVVARLLVISAALLFSTGGAAIKATSLTGWQTAGARSLIAAIALCLLIPEARKGWNWRIVPVALVYAATLICFVLANKMTTSANTIFLQSTAPAYLLVLGPLVLHEPIRRADVCMTVFLVLGMALLLAGYDAPVRTASNPPLGNILAAFSGFTYGLTLTGLRWIAKRSAQSSALATVVAGNAIVFLFAVPQSWSNIEWTHVDLVVVLYLGCIQIATAYWLLTSGMRYLSAFEASALLLVEPVLNPFWSWLTHGEHPSMLGVSGGLVILAATGVRVWATRGETS